MDKAKSNAPKFFAMALYLIISDGDTKSAYSSKEPIHQRGHFCIFTLSILLFIIEDYLKYVGHCLAIPIQGISIFSKPSNKFSLFT